MKLILTLTAFFLSNLNYAQNDFSLKVGGQTTGITNAIKGQNQNGFGAYVGLLKEFKLDDKFIFQTEILYSYQTFNNVNINMYELVGGNIYENQDPRFDENYKSHFIKIPLVLKYQPKDIYLELGPELGFNLNSNLKFEDNWNEFPTINDKLERTNKFQFAFLIGVGYQFDEKLSTGLRIGWGISKFMEDSYIKNFNVSAGISYKMK